MSWNKSVFTNAGTDMMSEVLSGATMTITKAVGGSGTTEEASLAALTDVQEEKQTLKILGIEDASDSTGNDAGKRIKIQITNGDVEAGYILHQVGVYAKLADGDETLLFIMQDDRGVEIPSHTENSDFVIELFGVMAISNVANIKVTVDPSAVASVKMVNEQVAQVNTKIDKTKEDLQDEAKKTYMGKAGGKFTGPLILADGYNAYGVASNAAAHNAMPPRFKNLGTTATSDIYAAIKAGTFDDIFVGDYFMIGSNRVYIGAFDWNLNCGDTACTEHHALLVPENNLYNYHMNATNTTEGGYVGSDMYKNGLTQAKQFFNDAFGEAHILKHRQYLVNAVTNGKPTGTDWYDSTVELMNENMVYGGRQFSPMPDGSDPWNTCRNYTIDKGQIPLFQHAPWLICNRAWYWLRDVVSAATFADVDSDGFCACASASNTGGVRPVAGLIG